MGGDTLSGATPSGDAPAARPRGRVLVYGAYGYTGELVARHAVARGLAPVLAGRRAEPLRALARELGVEWRAFALDDAAAVDQGMAGCSAVLHCAGPFSRTWRPVAEACLRAPAHYVDITGEVEVFEALAALDARARDAGVMLLPGAGFDVVPTSCLAAHLQRRLPTATSIAFAVQGFGGVSRGTARTVVEGVSRGRSALGGARLRTRTFDLGRGPFPAAAFPTADVFAARYATGLEVSFFYPARPATRAALRALPWVAPLARVLRVPALRDLAARLMTGGAPGPDASQRARGAVTVQGEARDPAGAAAIARLRLPDGYTFTALAAVAICERILSGIAPAGFQTPATAYGPDLVLAMEGVRRDDLKTAGGPPVTMW